MTHVLGGVVTTSALSRDTLSLTLLPSRWAGCPLGGGEAEGKHRYVYESDDSGSV